MTPRPRRHAAAVPSAAAAALAPVAPALAQATPTPAPTPTGLTLETFLFRLGQVWEAELFKAGDTAIALNQIVVALLVVVVGAAVSRRLTLIVRGRLVKTHRIDVHAAALIQKLLFYTLIAIVVLVALPIAGIPITIFTVLSGAAAIGIGLGTQDLFKNLIAGLTLMLEKPIRIGDIVQVGEHAGRIEEIGNRVTRLRKFDGIDVLVPNNHFLDSPVVNWTLFDNRIEGSVTVGVAYGSDTHRVAELLRQAADEHPKVLKEPGVEVFFRDFGADALVFEVEFWTDIHEPEDLERVCSDVRFRIEALCREAGVCIAYPQRDVHLDAARPIDLRIIGPAADALHRAGGPNGHAA